MIGVGSPTFCMTPFTKMLEEISRCFELWEILSEGEDRLEVIGDGIRYGRESYGMHYQVHAPLSDVNIGSVHEPMRLAALNEIQQTMVLCHRLEIPLVTIHPGFVQGIAFLDRRKALEKTRESVRVLSEFSKRHSVEMVVENLPANMNATCSTASELLEVLEGTDVRVCFDMGHANTAGQVDELLELIDRFGNVHLHNNEGQWDQHNKVDDGSADIRKVVSVLKRSFKGNMIIEATDLQTGTESKSTLEKLLG
jgi:sugar phosphate isomerase/epimerase